MRSLRVGLILVFVGGCLSSSWASDSLGFDVLGGVGTSGYDLNGSLDIKPVDVPKPFVASLSFAHQYTTVGTISRTNQITGGLDHALDDNWDTHGNLTFWKDNINDIHYAGPTLGFTYTWLEGPSGAGAVKPASEDQTATEPASKNEAAALTVDADLFFYGTEVETSSTTRKVFDHRQNRFVTQTVSPHSGTIELTQFHPNATFEKPFLDSAATPYLTVGHYFYSRDPADVEALSGRPRFASSINQINGLVGGFFNNNGEAGVRIALPWDIDSDFRLGADQEVTDNTWSTTQGITLTRTFFDRIEAKLDWSRAIQDGISSDIITGGLTYTF